MGKNIYQKAKEHGLIEGYIPMNDPVKLIDFYKKMAETAASDPRGGKLVSVFQDAAAIIELHAQQMEMIVNAYEEENPPCNIKVLAKA